MTTLSSRAGAAVAVATTLLLPSSATATEPMPAPVTILNRSDGPIACEAKLAHWFSAAFGEVATGDARRIALVRRTDGTVTLDGPGGEAMAVEALWCGRPGRTWTTRAAIALPRVADGAGPVGWPERIVCEGGGRLRCRADAPVRPSGH